MSSDIRTFVKNDAQKYIDEPIYAKPRDDRVSAIARSISTAFNKGRDRTPKPILVGYERVTLRWMEPGKNGEMKIKYPHREKK